LFGWRDAAIATRSLAPLEKTRGFGMTALSQDSGSRAISSLGFHC
jgi:hypothetical protein